ncbi:MAG: VWA domain-containing protein [Deltaproteobacteria bacterium]|nr:VWA domain-containing protein [Deltaproteobacteria bacterium]
MRKIFHNQSGIVLITFALLLFGLMGFAALGMEVGRWYLVRSELSKSADAAAMAAAKNISNPYVDLNALVQEIGRENFPPGYLDTPSQGDGSVSFSTQVVDSKDVKVTGAVSTNAILARLFGVTTISTQSAGVAQKNEVEIMMVLDRSGSMAGTPLADLKNAAKGFLEFFQETQDKDKMGLISFATGVTVDRALGTNFVTAMKTKINAMAATGATNAENAIDQADGPLGFTDQTGVPGDKRVQQYLIFFTDGYPTAFKSQFRRDATDYDAVVMGTGQQCDSVYGSMGHTDSEVFYSTSTLAPTPTGDGNKTSGSPLTNCKSASSPHNPYANTRWYVFADPKYGLAGYDPLQCTIPSTVLAPYICTTARNMAIDHAQELKDKNIKIFVIGLGNVDKTFLGKVASGSSFEYYAPTSDELESIFKMIAKEIKLRLVA